MDHVTIQVSLSHEEVWGLAQLVKRLDRRSLGRDDLNLVTPEEAGSAETALLALREALTLAGYAPR